MNKDPVVITGRGLITPLGDGLASNLDALKNGKSGLQKVQEWVDIELDSHVGGVVNNFENCEWVDRKAERFMTKNSKMAVKAAYEALNEAQLTRESLSNSRVALLTGCVGSSYQEIYEGAKTFIETRKTKRVLPYIVPRVMANSAAANLSLILGVHGESWDICSACSSSGHAIMSAARLLMTDEYDTVICGGTEELNWVHALGFNAMRALSKSNDDPIRASRPFDRTRDGFVMAEGAGILVLERLSHALKRGAKPITILSGWGANSNASDMVVPDVYAGAKVMLKALNLAHLNPADLTYINTHGTATPVGDPVEMEAIRQAVYMNGGNPFINSTKSMTGHMIGATAACEAIFTSLMIENQFVCPTINLVEPEAAFDWAKLPTETINNVSIKHALSNSFGFGGTNIALILSHPSVISEN